MKNSLIIAFLMPFALVSCIAIEPEPQIPIQEKEKKILFDFFTDKDYSSLQYVDHSVILNVGVSLVDKKTAREIKILEETTGWIPFETIPDEFNKIRFEKSVTVDRNKYSVNYGYSYQVRIGETIQMKAIGEFLKDWEDEKLIRIKF